mmetsp:Transcript_17015/g.2813  ORF Transcript_17015/g.2813 Transcript_17015/m.2813 type:complete len:207 (+) Transcript_17015:45-665(+)
MSEKVLGPLSVIGAGIGYIIVGFPHSWGGLNTYMMSYHTHYSPDLNPKLFDWIYSIILIGEAGSFLTAPFVTKSLSSRKLVMLMSVVLSLSILTSYFTFNSLLTCFLFALGTGYTSGMIQIACIYPPTSYYPNSIGKITCVLNTAFTVGFGIICTFYKIICNPDNLQVDPETMMYPIDVIENFPRLLITVASVILFFGMISFILMT